MGITIIGGGCRDVSDDGKIRENECDSCFKRGVCEFEPRARELAEFSKLWMRTDDDLPPEMTPILYLEHPSEDASGTVHYGYFDSDSRTYRQLPSGKPLSAECVIAWMPVPEIPRSIYKNRNSGYQHI